MLTNFYGTLLVDKELVVGKALWYCCLLESVRPPLKKAIS